MDVRLQIDWHHAIKGANVTDLDVSIGCDADYTLQLPEAHPCRKENP